MVVWAMLGLNESIELNGHLLSASARLVESFGIISEVDGVRVFSKVIKHPYFQLLLSAGRQVGQFHCKRLSLGNCHFNP